MEDSVRTGCGWLAVGGEIRKMELLYYKCTVLHKGDFEKCADILQGSSFEALAYAPLLHFNEFKVFVSLALLIIKEEIQLKHRVGNNHVERPTMEIILQYSLANARLLSMNILLKDKLFVESDRSVYKYYLQ